MIVVDDREAICTQITEGSDHYQPDERSLGIGVQAFQAFGITFLSEPIVYGERGQEPEGESHEEGEIDLLEVMRRFGLDGGPGEIAEEEGLYEARQHDGDEHDGGQGNGDGGGNGKEGPIKWVVLERSQLLTDPSLVANTVLTASEAVIAAGDYIDVVEGNERFCIEVTTDSGNSHIEVVQEPEIREVADGNDGGHGGDHDGYDEPSSHRNEEIDKSDRDREKGIFEKLQEEAIGWWQMLASRKRTGDEGTSQRSGVQVRGDSQAQLSEGGGDGNGGGDDGDHVVHDGYDNDSDEDDKKGEDASRLIVLLPDNYRDSWYTSGNFQQSSDNFGGTSGTTYADIASWGTSGNQQQWSEVSITSGTNYGDSHQEPTDSTTNQAELEKASKETRIYKELEDRKCL